MCSSDLVDDHVLEPADVWQSRVPAQHAERKTNELGFEPPLDIVDGAARVVDPVFEAERTGQFIWGKFFKDYKPTSW